MSPNSLTARPSLQLAAVAATPPAPLHSLTLTAFQIEVFTWQQHAHFWLFAGDLFAVQQNLCYDLCDNCNHWLLGGVA